MAQHIVKIVIVNWREIFTEIYDVELGTIIVVER